MTQIVSEESRARPPAPLHAVVEEPLVGSSQEPSSSKSTTSSQEVTGGGLFAGIGHFPPTPKPDSQSSRCPPIRYKPDATLRWVDDSSPSLVVFTAEVPYSDFQRFPSKSTLLMPHLLKSHTTIWILATAWKPYWRHSITMVLLTWHYYWYRWSMLICLYFLL